jgi:hypothetical protein
VLCELLLRKGYATDRIACELRWIFKGLHVDEARLQSWIERGKPL